MDSHSLVFFTIVKMPTSEVETNWASYDKKVVRIELVTNNTMKYFIVFLLHEDIHTYIHTRRRIDAYVIKVPIQSGNNAYLLPSCWWVDLGEGSWSWLSLYANLAHEYWYVGWCFSCEHLYVWVSLERKEPCTSHSFSLTSNTGLKSTKGGHL